MMAAFHFTKKRFLIALLGAFVIVTGAGWYFTGRLVDRAMHTVKTNVDDANLIISLHLINELKRIESAAVSVAGSPLTLPVLQAKTPANMDKINNILDRYHKSLDAAACYLIDASGLTLASSNRNAKDSFVGQNYTFRPYFQDAVKGGTGRYFAFGTVSKRRGFYAAAPVRDKDGAILGVVAIKKELDDIENKLSQYIWFLADANGIVFLSSQPEARLKSLWPLEEGTRQKIIQSKQFGPGPFEPLMKMQFQAGTEIAFRGNQYLAAKQATPYEGVFVMLLWPTDQIVENRLFGIVLTLLSNLLVLSFLTVIYIFDRSNRKTKTLLEESQSHAMALSRSEGQLREQKVELESQREALLSQRSELERSRETLAQTEERSRLILSSVSEGIFGLDRDGITTFVNPAASAMLGFAAEEMVGRPMHQLVHYSRPDGSPYARQDCHMFKTSTDGKMRVVSDEVLWRKDGSAVEIEYSTTPIYKNGDVVGTVVSFRDIAERKKADALKVEKEVAEEAAVHAEEARREAERVQEELKAKVAEIERFHRLSMGREERVIELKRQVNELALKMGEKPFYKEQQGEDDTVANLLLNDSTGEDIGMAEVSPDGAAEMLSVDMFQRLLEDFCDSVGIAAAIIDLKGKVLASARWQRVCTDFHRVNEITCARCIESDTELASNLSEGKAFSVYRCKNGLTDAASPIIVNGRHIANTFVGQFFTEPPDMEYFWRQAEECGFDQDKYMEAIWEVPIVAEDKLESILGFLVGVSQTVATMSVERNLAKQAELTIARRIEESRQERLAAMSLAEDAQHARDELERYKDQLEALVRERTDELRESEERSRLILTSVGDGLFGLDRDGMTTFVNPAAMQLLGYTDEELVGKDLHDKVHYAHPDGSPFARASCPMHHSSQDGKSRTVDNEVLWKKDGTALQVEYSTTPVFKGGQVVGTVITFRDITERKRAEETIRRAEKRSRTILDSISVGTIIINPRTRMIEDLNPVAAGMIGLPKEEIVGKICHRFICPKEERQCPIVDLGQSVDSAERVLLNGEGREIPVIKTVRRVTLGDGEYLLESFVDISDRKKMEEELKEHLEELEKFMELTINREEKMIELKEEINVLLVSVGQSEKYRIVE